MTERGDRPWVSLKSLFEKQRVGVNQLDAFPRADKSKLFRWSRESDLAYACICKIVEAAQDPDLIVERRKNADSPWERDAGHPLRQLMMRPCPEMTEAEFFGAWLSSEEVCGEFFAEKVRDKRMRVVALYPLDPTKMEPTDDGRWKWKDNGAEVILSTDDVFHSIRPDFQRPWAPLAPLAVALGAIEADSLQTSFTRAFFKSGGVPSGIIKIKNKSLTQERMREISQNWVRRFGFGGVAHNGPAVLDENSDYEKVGSDLREIEGESLRAFNETRICGVFGVPPLLVSALVGLKFVNQRSSAMEAQREFWANKMSPTFKRLRSALTWDLLLEFEDENSIRMELVRLNWDMSQVIALQETMSERSLRAREDFRAGLLTLNQAISVLGYPPQKGGDYYLRPVNRIPVTPEVIAAQAEAAAGAAEASVAIALSGVRDPAAQLSDSSSKNQKSGQRWQYVAESDGSTCKACSEANGMTANNESDLPPVPNPDCGSGFGKCRCTHVLID